MNKDVIIHDSGVGMVYRIAWRGWKTLKVRSRC
jgi:hypothetical protein